MQIVTPKQMGKLEDISEKLGVSKRQLMENAGRKLAELIDGYCRNEAKLRPEDSSVVFLAGTGNNGGDCYAAADNCYPHRRTAENSPRAGNAQHPAP